MIEQKGAFTQNIRAEYERLRAQHRGQRAKLISIAEARANAHYITQLAGGFGAVREVCELILKSQGHWDDLMQRYLKTRDEGGGMRAEG